MTEAWTFRGGVSTEHVFDFLLCVVDTIDAVNELKDADKDNVGLKAISTARRISIPLRKLLLDGKGHLFKSCFVDPNFHPLKRPSSPSPEPSFKVPGCDVMSLTTIGTNNGLRLQQLVVRDP